MRLEEAHDGGNEVPGEVDGDKVKDGLECNLVGEEHAEGMDERCVLTLCLCSLTGGFPITALFEFPLHIPCDEGHDEEGEEDDT